MFDVSLPRFFSILILQYMYSFLKNEFYAFCTSSGLHTMSGTRIVVAVKRKLQELSHFHTCRSTWLSHMRTFHLRPFSISVSRLTALLCLQRIAQVVNLSLGSSSCWPLKWHFLLLPVTHVSPLTTLLLLSEQPYAVFMNMTEKYKNCMFSSVRGSYN